MQTNPTDKAGDIYSTASIVYIKSVSTQSNATYQDLCTREHVKKGIGAYTMGQYWVRDERTAGQSA